MLGFLVVPRKQKYAFIVLKKTNFELSKYTNSKFSSQNFQDPSNMPQINFKHAFKSNVQPSACQSIQISQNFLHKAIGPFFGQL